MDGIKDQKFSKKAYIKSFLLERFRHSDEKPFGNPFFQLHAYVIRIRGIFEIKKG